MKRRIKLMVVLSLEVASDDGFREPTSGQAIDALEEALHSTGIGHSVETARELHYGERPLIRDLAGDIWHLAGHGGLQASG